MFLKSYGQGVIVLTFSPMINTYKAVQEFGNKTTHYFRLQPQSSPARGSRGRPAAALPEGHGCVLVESGMGWGSGGTAGELGVRGGDRPTRSLAEPSLTSRTFPFSLVLQSCSASCLL